MLEVTPKKTVKVKGDFEGLISINKKFNIFQATANDFLATTFFLVGPMSV
jgi:hypothetical protein